MSHARMRYLQNNEFIHYLIMIILLQLSVLMALTTNTNSTKKANVREMSMPNSWKLRRTDKLLTTSREDLIFLKLCHPETVF